MTDPVVLGTPVELPLWWAAAIAGSAAVSAVGNVLVRMFEYRSLSRFHAARMVDLLGDDGAAGLGGVPRRAARRRRRDREAAARQRALQAAHREYWDSLDRLGGEGE